MSNDPVPALHLSASPGPAAPKPVSIHTARITLRRPMPSDLAPFLAAVAAARDGLAQFCPIHREGEDDEALFHRLVRGDDGAGITSLRLLGVLDDGQIAGGFNLVAISAGLEKKSSINWWVAPPHAGQGLATEGVAAMLDHALTDAPPFGDGLGLHLVEAWITRDNPASIRVAEKTGFKRRPDDPSPVRLGDHWVMHDLYVRRVDDPT